MNTSIIYNLLRGLLDREDGFQQPRQDGFQQPARTASENDPWPEAQSARPPVDAFPVPLKAVTDVLEGPFDALNAGGYAFSLYQGSQLIVSALGAPRRIGGTYLVSAMPMGGWFALNERRGHRLPVLVSRSSPTTFQIRIDPAPMPSLPAIDCARGF